MNSALFEGELVRLTAFDVERDAEVESQWTHDAEYLRMLSPDPARPLSPFHVKKKYETQEKESNLYHFAVRTRAEDRLVGFAQLRWVEWNNGAAVVWLGIGHRADRGQGFGRDALQLILRYGFGELNLYRLSAIVSEYNARAQQLALRAGFALEVRRRQAIQRDGRAWDQLHFGLRRENWHATEGKENS